LDLPECSLVGLLVLLGLLIGLPLLAVGLGGFNELAHGRHDLGKRCKQGDCHTIHEAWLHLGDLRGLPITQEGNRKAQLLL
jgi:hypothetical protein